MSAGQVLLTLVGVAVAWWLWVAHRAAVIVVVAVIAVLVAVAHAPSVRIAGPVVLLFAVVLVTGWVCRAGGASPTLAGGGRACNYGCTYRGHSVRDIAEHEAGHVSVAEQLGYRVIGAEVFGRGDGGLTRLAKEPTPADAIVIAAAGSSAENLSRLFFVEPINGSKTDGRSDAWTAYRYAPGVAAQRGSTPRQVIRQGELQAHRILTGPGRARYQQAAAELRQNRRIGDPL